MRPLLALLLPLVVGCGSKTALVTGSVDDGGVDSSVPDTSVPDSAIDTSVVDTAVDTRLPCVSDDECNDGVFCNGLELCSMGGCVSGTPIECMPPPDGCTEGLCDEMLQECVFRPVDRDLDLHFLVACGGDDCDDEDPTVFGGAIELCDYQDNDCDMQVDERLPYVGLGTARDVSEGTSGAIRPDVGWSGSEYQVVFDSDEGTGQVFLASVRRNGRPMGSADPVTFSSVLASSADIHWTGTEYGMWHHFHLDEAFQGTVSLTRIDGSGRVIRRAVAATPDVPDADVPGSAWSGTDWGVAFVASRSTGAREIRFFRADRTGRTTVMPTTLSGPLAIPFVKPAVAWTGRRFVVAWGEGSAVRLVGLNPAGTMPAWSERVPSADQPQVSLAWSGTELMVSFTSTTRVDGVHLARFSDAGAMRGSFVDLTPDAAQQTGVDSVWSADVLAVTYQRGRTAAPGTYVVRVADGARWISPPGLVDDRIATDHPGSAIADTGREYGVAYPASSPRRGAIFFRRAGCE
jgi:hypothetical protein